MYPKIAQVEAGSPAEQAGVRAGERLRSINGHPIVDILDYRFHSAERLVVLELETEHGRRRRVRIRNPDYLPLGLVFETGLIDQPRACANRCVFCFIDQLPPGLRETLYFKDDDARLSFLQGNYITLTNLSEREMSRIIDLHISPLHVSVHTMDPQLRVRMLRNPRAAEGPARMRRLAEAGIAMHGQIVCCPGVNDGDALRYSLEQLAALFPQVQSVSVVPVGLTRYRDGLPLLRPCLADDAAKIIDMVDSFGNTCENKFGTRLFYCADELYLKAGRALPPYTYYEDFPQFENGVGMLRSLEAEFLQALERVHCPRPLRFSIATGRAAAPMLRQLMEQLQAACPGVQGQVYAIENRFFGPMVDVAGLVTGQDLLAQLRGAQLGCALLLPAAMLRHGGDLFLDGVTPAQLEQAFGVPIIPVANDGAALLEAICALPAQVPSDSKE